MAKKHEVEKQSPPKDGARYVRLKTPPKSDRTRTEDPKDPPVLFNDWASI